MIIAMMKAMRIVTMKRVPNLAVVTRKAIKSLKKNVVRRLKNALAGLVPQHVAANKLPRDNLASPHY
jgi:hypothetical protein